MTMRGLIDLASAFLRPASQAGHVRFGAGFVEENEFRWIEQRLLLLPLFAALFYVGPVLLTRS